MLKQVPSNRGYQQFLIIFSYVSLNGDEPSPVMAICGKASRSSYIIPLANAYYYANSMTGNPSKELLADLEGIANRLELSTDKFMLSKIAEAIIDNLPDLIKMPPKAPPSMRQLEEKAEKQGLVVKMGGKTLLDAS